MQNIKSFNCQRRAKLDSNGLRWKRTRKYIPFTVIEKENNCNKMPKILIFSFVRGFSHIAHDGFELIEEISRESFSNIICQNTRI